MPVDVVVNAIMQENEGGGEAQARGGGAVRARASTCWCWGWHCSRDPRRRSHTNGDTIHPVQAPQLAWKLSGAARHPYDAFDAGGRQLGPAQ